MCTWAGCWSSPETVSAAWLDLASAYPDGDLLQADDDSLQPLRSTSKNHLQINQSDLDICNLKFSLKTYKSIFF